jgi:nucleoside-diphosphate-sugar epimerase
MHILITGATGFLGRAVAESLLRDRHAVRAAVRKVNASLPSEVEQVTIGSIDGGTNWGDALRDVDVIVHCAARVHMTRDAASDPLVEFRRVNTDGTLHLARQAVESNVKRLIFISTIGVNGSETADMPFTAESPVFPNSAYAQSKWEAEEGLMALAAGGKMDIVVLRPPLIYGPNAPGNFASLSRLVSRHFPFPFKGVANKRSFVAVDNVVSLIQCCLSHPGAANQIFLVSDGKDLSTEEFIRKIAVAYKKTPILLPFPQTLLRGIAKFLGKETQLQKIVGSLQVDIKKNADVLNWHPVAEIEQVLAGGVLAGGVSRQHMAKQRSSSSP